MTIVLIILFALAVAVTFSILIPGSLRNKGQSSPAKKEDALDALHHGECPNAQSGKGDTPKHLQSESSISQSERSQEMFHAAGPAYSLSHERVMSLLATQDNNVWNEAYVSTSHEEQITIRRSVGQKKAQRERRRMEQLEKYDNIVQKVVQSISDVEFDIAENDSWFRRAQRNEHEFSRLEVKKHKEKAAYLYSKRKKLIEKDYPKSQADLSEVIEKIEISERLDYEAQLEDIRIQLRPSLNRINEEKRELQLKEVRAAKEIMAEKEAAKERAQREWDEIARGRERLQRQRAAEERRRLEQEEERKAQERVDLIRHIAARKGLKYLIHFTPADNLDSIEKYGLLSRTGLGRRSYTFTDSFRGDGWLDWISLSVSFPNYKMLFSKQNNMESVKGWAILLLDCSILWELDCRFVITNASSSSIKLFNDGIWGSAKAFSEMFEYHQNRQNVHDSFTTDPQAEVMVRECIPIKYIKGVAVKDKSALMGVDLLSSIRAEVRPDLFGPRSDYEYWRGRSLSPSVIGVH